jgi:hypothetical protein
MVDIDGLPRRDTASVEVALGGVGRAMGRVLSAQFPLPKFICIRTICYF